MRTALFLCMGLFAAGLAAHANEPAVSGNGPIEETMNAGTLHYHSADHLSWHLPFYYGRGEWRVPQPCCPAPDGTSWGCCPNPRSYGLHLWDNYCYESTPCPHCGHSLGGLGHYLLCESRKKRCTGGCGKRQGCADRAEQAADAAGDETKDRHTAPRISAPNPPVPPRPTADDVSDASRQGEIKATPQAKVKYPSPSTGYPFIEKGSSADAKWRPVLAWPRLQRSR